MKQLRTLAAIFLVCFSLSTKAEDVYEVGKEGDAPEPPSVKQLTEREICGEWKAAKVGNNESPVDDLYIYYGDNGFAFEGKYKDWHGQAMAGTESKVTVWRKPKAEEMSDKAPQWAREKIAAEGKLEWKLELKAESRKGEWVLEGKWYPGQFKWYENEWNETGESDPAGRQASYLDQGTPVDVKFKKVPTIVGDPIVVNNQRGSNKGVPWHPYPHAGQGGDSRLLFICGVNLPMTWGEAKIQPSDNTIGYEVYALATDNNLNADRKRLFKAGWDATLKGLDRETEQATRKCGAILIKAGLQPGVTPGVKKLSVNGMPTSWPLAFGDDGSVITFARDIDAEQNEPINCAYLPEKIYIEVTTKSHFPNDEIPIRIMQNKEEVNWSGANTISAKYVKDLPAEEHYDRPIDPVRIYRTSPIQLVVGTAEKGSNIYNLPVKAEDVLLAVPEDPYLLFSPRLPPPAGKPLVAAVKIWNTPDRDVNGNLIPTWEETLERAAILDGYAEKVKAGQNVAGSQAASIGNYVITNVAFRIAAEVNEYEKSHANSIFLSPPLRFARWWFGILGVDKYGGPIEPKRSRSYDEHVNVTVADHAALLLYKDAFIRKMSEGLAGVEKETKSDGAALAGSYNQEERRRAILLGIRDKLKVSATKESSPWESIRVPGPNGGDVKMSWALDDGLRKAACQGCTDARAEEWSLDAVENGLAQYKDAIRHAIQKAKDTPDSGTGGKSNPGFADSAGANVSKEEAIKKLIELIGYGYEHLYPDVAQHMMWHPSDANDSNWHPNHNARMVLWHLHTDADCIRAQEDLSKLDTQMALLAASALSAPLMFSGSIYAAVALYALDVGSLTYQVVTETIPEFVEQYQREEIRFAIGASLVLGTERLNEAELKRTEWFQTVLNVLPSAIGVTMGAEGLHAMTRANAKTKASFVADLIKNHGLEGAKHLTNSEKLALIIASSEAETLKEMGAAKAMLESHERAAQAGEKLAAEAGIARKAPAEAPGKKVQASGSGAREELKPFNAEGKPEPDIYHKADVEPLVVSNDEAVPERPPESLSGPEVSGEGKPRAPPATEKYPTQEFPPEKPTGVQKPPVTEKQPPVNFPPEKPTGVQKPEKQPAGPQPPETQKYPAQDFPPEKATGVQKRPETQPAAPQPREKTPRVLRTGAEFRELVHPQEVPGQPKPTGKGVEVRVRLNGELVDLTLGEKLGEGGFAGVWEVADGPAKYKGKAVKITFLDDGEVWRMPPSGLNASKEEAEKLSHLGYKQDVDTSVEILNGKNNTGKKFEHAVIYGTGADENAACVIQEKINRVGSPSVAAEGDCIMPNRDRFMRWSDKYGLADAVVELFWELKEAGVVWEDCKLSNMYFRKKNGKWVAGILDVDRIYLFTDRAGRRGSFLDWAESVNVFHISHDGQTPNVNSLYDSTKFPWKAGQGARNFLTRSAGALVGPYFRDAEEFMMIMFEYQGWIRYDPVAKKFVRRLIDPDIIQRQIFPGHTEPTFPRLSDEARFKPRNLDKPYRAAFLDASEPVRGPPNAPREPPPPGPDNGKPPPPAAGGGNAPPRQPPAPPTGGNPAGPPGSEPRAGWIPEKNAYLEDLIRKNYGDDPLPPMHTTDVASLEKIRSSKILEAPMSGASWSYSGTLREGNVAIRLTPEGQKFVVLEPASEGTGLVPKYYPEGVDAAGKGGQFKSYIPAEYLEYYNWKSDAWLPVKR